MFDVNKIFDLQKIPLLPPLPNGIEKEVTKEATKEVTKEATKYDYSLLEPINIWETPEPDAVVLELIVNETSYPIIQLGDISVIVSNAKTGKSKITMEAIFAFILRTVVTNYDGELIFKATADNISVLAIDTENSKRNLLKNIQNEMRKIGITEGTKINNFYPYHFRNVPHNERIEQLKYLLEKHKDVSVVFIDGFTDLAPDAIMEHTPATLAVSNLMQSCDNRKIGILGTIHKNQASQLEKARGHFGAELERKAFSVISIQDGKIKCNFARDSGTFPDLPIVWDDETFTFKRCDTAAETFSENKFYEKFFHDVWITYNIPISLKTLHNSYILTARASGRKEIKELQFTKNIAHYEGTYYKKHKDKMQNNTILYSNIAIYDGQQSKNLDL